MAIIVRMPEIATGTAEAAIAGWMVAVGDEITSGQPIVEIETEKATVEYEAEDAGVLAGLLLDAGVAAAVGTPIAVLATGGQSADEALAEAGVEAGVDGDPAVVPEAGAAEPEAEGSVSAQDADLAPEEAPALEEAPVVAQTADPEPERSAAAPEADAGDRQFASPLVRKLVRERGLDLQGVTGSGPNGRIVRRDVEALQPAADRATAAPTEAPATPAAATPAPAATPQALPGAGYVDTPHTGMRRAIARRLTESKSTVPHFYLVAHCRMDALLGLRSQINAIDGVKVSVNDLVVKAVAGALTDVPAANAIWTDEATRTFDGVDIAIAVSVPAGLLTPVVRGVEKLSLGQLGAQIRDLASRARDGKLKQHELEGGSFSVSNLGMYGTSEFSAILNPPQSGILAVGAAEQRPVVQEDGSLGVATVMTVTLSADHRVLDGALAAEWLAAFQQRIEHPMSILI